MRRSSDFQLFFMVLAGISCVFIGAYSASQSKEIAREKLSREGYTEVVMTGWKPFSMWCDSRAGVAQSFRGTLGGQQREGYVCTSLMFSYIVD